MLKFEEDCLKNEGDRFLVKRSFFAFLVFPSRNLLRSRTLDHLYLKSYLEFFQAVKNV